MVKHCVNVRERLFRKRKSALLQQEHGLTPPDSQTKAAARISRASAARASSLVEREASLLPTAAPTMGVERKVIAVATIIKIMEECILMWVGRRKS